MFKKSKKKQDMKWIEKLPIEERKLYENYIRETVLRENIDLSYLVKWKPEERKDTEEEIKQKFYINYLAGDKIKDWAKDMCVINHIDCYIFYFHKVVCVTIYYETISEAKKYREDGTSEKLREKYLQFLRETDYYKYFPNEKLEWCGKIHDNVVIEFDSYERIKRDCSGIYRLRYR